MERKEVASSRLPIKPSTHTRLQDLVERQATYDEFINELIDFREEFANERDLHHWILDNHEALGFKRIIESNLSSFPDLVVEDFSGKVHRVEIEMRSGNFMKHGHDPSKVDLVICLYKNKDIEGVKVIELRPFKRRWACPEDRRNNKERKVNITVYLEEKTIEMLDNLIKEGEIISRGEAIREALYSYFDLEFNKGKGKPF